MGFRSQKNPLDEVPESDEPGHFREEINQELSVMQREYRARQDAEKKRRQKATDSEYWVAVCFESREQKEEFLAKVGVKPNLHGDKYINGKILASKVGVSLNKE